MSEAPESMSEKNRASACPICKKQAEQRYLPFCSKRCADVDLNRWLSGSYAIPVADDTDEDGEDDVREPLSRQ
jgi:endogenous inhibitor of DNA gyrase (YacG/DUF329 family)